MANLATRDTIFNDLFDFRRDLNSIFSRLVTGAPFGSERHAHVLTAVPPIEAWVDKDEKKYHLSIALTGVDPKDIEVNVQGNNLMVSAEQKANEEKKGRTICTGNSRMAILNARSCCRRASTLRSSPPNTRTACWKSPRP
jgi:HSP20 family molecular chaperone IbpA